MMKLTFGKWRASSVNWNGRAKMGVAVWKYTGTENASATRITGWTRSSWMKYPWRAEFKYTPARPADRARSSSATAARPYQGLTVAKPVSRDG